MKNVLVLAVAAMLGLSAAATTTTTTTKSTSAVTSKSSSVSSASKSSSVSSASKSTSVSSASKSTVTSSSSHSSSTTTTTTTTTTTAWTSCGPTPTFYLSLSNKAIASNNSNVWLHYQLDTAPDYVLNASDISNRDAFVVNPTTGFWSDAVGRVANDDSSVTEEIVYFDPIQNIIGNGYTPTNCTLLPGVNPGTKNLTCISDTKKTFNWCPSENALVLSAAYKSSLYTDCAAVNVTASCIA